MRKSDFSCCIFAATLISVPALGCSKPMKMTIEQWPPYIYTDAKNQAAGLDIEIAKAIFKEAGCILEIGAEVPRKRRQYMFSKGEIDVMLAASKTPEREAFSYFSSPYRNESVSLFTSPKKLEKYQSIDSFGSILKQRITLLAPNAGWYGDDYKSHYFWLNEANLLSPFETFAQAIKMFEVNRAELVMGDTGALVYEAKLKKLPLAALPKLVLNDNVRLMLNKKSTTEADLNALNAAMARLEKRGVLEKIRTQYGMGLNEMPRSTPEPATK
ncbi:transporter substrate-binding domain-containing protein [Deefgea tanakiae]|uniref:Transporter substrate-binding domain-containing protein n=1 Tax=Deefgea tanakiae TaxID=2865840 RepID=A0ABX8Z4W0_9NEIS|nr:transporter substrate-binding domain-containing protein [Deefgea tanakiae]QZA77622.1 transporter substrate-binding domain-containing protein [Deefgea tanakiae]